MAETRLALHKAKIILPGPRRRHLRIRLHLFGWWTFRKFRRLVPPRRAALGKHGGCKGRNFSTALGPFDTPMLRRPVGFDQADIEIEGALRDRRAEVDGKGQRIAGPWRVGEHPPPT